MIEAVVVEIDPRSGEVRLGRSMGRPAGLDQLAIAHAAGVAVEGKVSGVNKGGLEVEVAGVRAFCPISQADRGYLADPQTLLGRTLLFLVTELRDTLNAHTTTDMGTGSFASNGFPHAGFATTSFTRRRHTPGRPCPTTQAPCGDGRCDEVENRCSCPTDCNTSQ